MADLLALQGWVHGSLSSSSRAPSPSRTTPQRLVSKAKSSNALSDIAGTKNSLAPPSLSTLPDPRLSRMTSTPELSQSGSSTPHHPDLSNEVAALSDKLIRAINHQTTLDDALSAARQDLDLCRERVEQLESEAKQHEEDIANGILVKRVDIEEENVQLTATLAEERKQKSAIEKDKKNIEQELENLTAALFEEANQMVAAAQKEREATERKNEQLRAQIKDTESLLASHQEQLAELKLVMQQMTLDREEVESHANGSTAPSSPALQSHEGVNRILEAMNISPATSGVSDMLPAPSTTFTHLVKPVCRTDIKAYEDFNALLSIARSSKPPSRVASGSYAGLNIMSLPAISHNSSGMNPPATNGPASHLVSPSDGSTPGTPLSGGVSPRESQIPTIPLKETRFYKRVLAEDIEPALRLDVAPGVSWLTRRAFLNSICEGGLVVEPMPSVARVYLYSCALCGEKRKGDINPRTHRFRTSDNETAQRHPLCVLCLEKVRASCDLVGYLKVIKDGHVRIEDAEEEKEAWEETVRLRERLFWSRIGGGVIPAFLDLKSPEKSPVKPPAEFNERQSDEVEEVESPAHREIETKVEGTGPDTKKEMEEVISTQPAESKFAMGKRLISRLSYGSLRSVRMENGHSEKEREPVINETPSQDQNGHDNTTQGSGETQRPEITARNGTDTSGASLHVTIPGSFA